ncbi:acetate kinase [Mariprofundus ferrinatatus]|uniref:Acetate kinase n=1 Tax=Mariprofundus ferrinatatus TaxID=1921087 RepID=A0A2K8L5J3_9PROT|nr:acetate kinase [Mariprofundus ferrinatatus]ATX82503.1 acetate kinase [Mariprofundus ferrinatatus]
MFETFETVVLVINTGSSSIKMALIDMPSEQMLAEGVAQRLGEADAELSWKIADEIQQFDLNCCTLEDAMQKMLDLLFGKVGKGLVTAVGHRVVHGGERFVAPTLLDDEVIAEIESLSHLAPLHNPSNLLGVREAMRYLPDVSHIAVFDTAFHYAMPKHASLYAVPYHWYSQYGVRRYGFHGTSHHYVAEAAAKCLGRPLGELRLITVHLGNGCSAAAVANGVSVDTTMGMTPLEGLVMGSRSGDVDPGLHEYMVRESGESLASVTDALNRQSGLLGISGLSNDMRTLLNAADSGNERAALAIEIFCYRLAKSLASLSVALGHVDAVVFTGGIGEHASVIREKTTEQLAFLSIKLDEERNSRHGRSSGGFITHPESSTPVLVVATSEEKMIARYVCKVVIQEDIAT